MMNDPSLDPDTLVGIAREMLISAKHILDHRAATVGSEVTEDIVAQRADTVGRALAIIEEFA